MGLRSSVQYGVKIEGSNFSWPPLGDVAIQEQLEGSTSDWLSSEVGHFKLSFDLNCTWGYDLLFSRMVRYSTTLNSGL
jgi:hypothetical protein